MGTGNRMSFDPDRPLSIFAYAYTSAVGVAILMFGPIIIGAYVDIEGMTETQAGYLFSLEMAGYALSPVLWIGLLSLPVGLIIMWKAAARNSA